MAGYDPGETLRVTRDAKGTLHLHHGARAIASITRTIRGDVRIEADGRTWRLKTTDDGWIAEGEPRATLRHRPLRSDVLTIGGERLTVSGGTVKTTDGRLVRYRDAEHGGRRALAAKIDAAPPGPDPQALVVLATAAAVLGADLAENRSTANLNGDNISAALRYGPGA